jgi:capsular exopolysaccharide synthesis family protein
VQYQATPANGQPSVATLEDYLDAIRKRKLLALIVAALALLPWVMYTQRRTLTYTTRATVVVNPSRVGSTDGRIVTPRLDREAAVLTGDQVAAAAAKISGPASGSVSATFKPDTDVITIKSTSTIPSDAAKLANSRAKAYVDQRVAEQEAFYTTSFATLRQQLDEVNKRIAAAQTQIAALDAQRAEIVRASPTTAAQLVTPLDSDRNALVTQIASDNTRARTAESDIAALERERTTQLPAARLVLEAGVPGAADGLGNRIFWIAGLLIALVLGTVASFLRERLDRKATGSRDIELALGRVVLGAIPKFGFRARSRALVMADDNDDRRLHGAQEAYRRLRSSLVFLARSEDIQSIVVTSQAAGEGKSTTAANLALTLASSGSNVTLISADIRRPSLESLFGVSNMVGLSSYLGGIIDNVPRERVGGMFPFDLIPSGPAVANAGELLASSRFSRLIAELTQDGGFVIVDTPPMSATADALAAAGATDGVVVVVDGARTETTDLLGLRSDLDRSGHRLIGAIMNRDATQRGLFSRRSNYGYYSSRRPAEPRMPRRTSSTTIDA